jgi:hypothetical protein
VFVDPLLHQQCQRQGLQLLGQPFASHAWSQRVVISCGESWARIGARHGISREEHLRHGGEKEGESEDIGLTWGGGRLLQCVIQVSENHLENLD